MSWTKGDLVKEAFAEVGLADYEFDLTPDERQTALRRLDSMIATWAELGIDIGYLMPSGPTQSSLNDDSGIPDWSAETIYLNLAVRIAPSFGKQVSPDTKTSAASGYNSLLRNATTPRPQLAKGMPRGAGNKNWGTEWRFTPTPFPDPLPVVHSDLQFTPE